MIRTLKPAVFYIVRRSTSKTFDNCCFSIQCGENTQLLYFSAVSFDNVPLSFSGRSNMPFPDVRRSTSKTFDKCCFSIQCGESTHFLAADTNAEAQRWVEALVEAWRYYVQNDRRMSHGMTGTMRTETMRTTRTVGGSYKEEVGLLNLCWLSPRG